MLGRCIAALRKEKGLTQTELGFRCDMEKPDMQRIEAGRTSPTILTLKKICVALELDFKELMDGL